MIEMTDFAESNEKNDRLVQMALREIDSGNLAEAMLLMNETEREIIYRNMSKRATTMIKEDIESISQNTPDHIKRKSLDFWIQMLRKHTKYFPEGYKTIHKEKPVLAGDSPEDLIDYFLRLSYYLKAHGAVSMEGEEEKLDDPLLKKGLELMIDGWDPLLIQNILEQQKNAILNEQRIRMEMIIEGISSITSHDNPAGTKMKLEAYLGR